MGFQLPVPQLVSRISAINSPIIPAPPLCLRQLPQDVQLILSHVQLGCSVLRVSGGFVAMGIPIFLSNSEFSVNIPFLEHVYSIYFGRSYVYIPFLEYENCRSFS